MSEYLYNPIKNRWRHVSTDTYIRQDEIDSMDDDVLKAYLYGQTQEVPEDIMIEAFRIIPKNFSRG